MTAFRCGRHRDGPQVLWEEGRAASGANKCEHQQVRARGSGDVPVAMSRWSYSWSSASMWTRGFAESTPVARTPEVQLDNQLCDLVQGQQRRRRLQSVSGQLLLRQGRPVVWVAGFLADEDDRTVKPLHAQGLDGADSGDRRRRR